MITCNDANVNRFSGFADCYDHYRPQMPVVVTEMLAQLAGTGEPRLVVDVGSGTGLSTRIWAGRAKEVIGIEPNDDMRGVAETSAHECSEGTRIHYRKGYSAQTGLPDGCADIVVCAQAFHWMEPAATLAEAARMLRSGGVFAAIDCDWPPTVCCEVDLAFRTLMTRVRQLETSHGVYESVQRWPKDKHLANITASGHFRFTNELVAHQLDSGNADHLVGLAMSFGSVEALVKLGLGEDEIGITTFREVADRVIGEEAVAWFYGYRVRFGVK